MTEHSDNGVDLTLEISEKIRAARAADCPLYISGGGSKRDILGRDCSAETLSVAQHRGIVDYQPGELVLSARAGTPLSELQACLAGEGQHLPFEPPQFDGRATLGGTLACNLSGPARPWAGSIRDAVLGLGLISGSGEILRFGGKVMKNVAGYDISRLQAGALGTLGVISEVSLKVLPQAEQILTLRYETSAAQAIELMNQRAATPKPLTGACWVDGGLYLRLSGAASAVNHTAQQWGGERLSPQSGATFWRQLREMELPFFAGEQPLWRLSMKATAQPHSEAVLIDWCGSQRWIRSVSELGAVQDLAGRGHVQLFRHGQRDGELRTPLDRVQQRLHRRLKSTFDPSGILNPGRLYSWM